MLSGSIRVDQSNLFGTNPEFRYKPFWSVGGKWRALEEGFIDVSWINKLDFRTSYGLNGNISNDFGPFNIASALTSFLANGQQSLAITTPAVSDLRWERTQTTNFGVDVGLFSGRLDIGLDFYHKKTSDLLAIADSDPTLGFSSVVKNDADIENKGIEISLKTVNVRTKDFTWFTNLTFTHNKNRVLEVFREDQISD